MNFQKIKRVIEPLFELNNAVFLLAIIVAVSLIWNTISAIEKNFTLQAKVDALSEEVELLDLENQNLDLNNEYYKTDAYLELAARDKLGKVGPGEKVLVLPDYAELKKQAKQSEEATTDAILSEDTSNFDQWLYFLFRRTPN